MMDFIKRLSSRKFLLVIAGLAVIEMFPDLSNAVLILVPAFIGVEGAADIFKIYKNAKTEVAAAETQRVKYEMGLQDEGRGDIVHGGQALQ